MIYLLILKIILIPLLLCLITFKYKFKSVFSLITHQIFTISWILTLMIVEDFSIIGIYWRVLLGVILLIQLVYSCFRFRKFSGSSKVWLKLGTCTYSILTLFYFIYATYCVGMIIVPEHERERALEISFPLSSGFYEVVHGGMHTALNYHYAYETQKYALDIVKINAFGQRKTPFSDSKALTNYKIYGDTVLSPVSGTVIDIIDGIGEHIPLEKRTRLSNMIVLSFQDYYILLIHLKPGSFTVKKGDSVHLLQPLAKVGNSGNSSEPHLHLHAIRETPDRLLIISTLHLYQLLLMVNSLRETTFY